MTPKQARAASLAALLRIERAASIRLSSAVRAIVRAAERDILLGRGPHVVLVGASHAIERALASDVVLVRSAARRQSRAAFEDEMKAAGYGALLVAAKDASRRDRARGVAAAKGVAAAWLGSAARISADEEKTTEAPREALSSVSARIETVAIAETASAFDEERDAVANDHADEARRRGLLVPLKVWDATEDRKTCAVCASLDGTVRPFGIDFPGGQIPGDVHPRCRCVLGVRPLPVPLGREAAPDEESAA